MATILIVDDDAHFRAGTRRILAAAGHDVEEADDGRLALEKCRHHPPDLVLLDIYMPETDGVEAMYQLGQAHPQLQVIAVSGGGRLGKESALEVMRALGAVRVLTKPFEREELLTLVQEVLLERPEA